MKIVKRLEWMRSYINSVQHLLPHLPHLKRISSKTGSRIRWQRIVGVLNMHSKTSYKMTLYINRHLMSEDKIIEYSTIDLLQVLAHELAHLEHWVPHTTAHRRLECRIMCIFMTKLGKSGYTTEEDEEKNGRFYERK